MSMSQVRLSIDLPQNKDNYVGPFRELYPSAFRMGVRIRGINVFVVHDDNQQELRKPISFQEDPSSIKQLAAERSIWPEPNDLITTLGRQADETILRPPAAFLFAAIDLARHARWLARPSMTPIGCSGIMLFELAAAAHFVMSGKENNIFNSEGAREAIHHLTEIAAYDIGVREYGDPREGSYLATLTRTMGELLKEMEPDPNRDLNQVYNLAVKTMFLAMRKVGTPRPGQGRD